MLRYIGKRLLTMIPMLLGISIISYLVMNLAPGDAADMFLDPELMGNNPEYVQQVREQLGLDQPVLVRYFKWLNEIFHGNFGFSYKSKQPVLQEIEDRIGITALLAGISIIMQLVIGVSLGIYCAKRQYKISDYIVSTLAMVGFSTPAFWFAMMMILVFATTLGWLPSSGLYTVGLEGSGWVLLWDRVKHLLMPAAAMSLSGIGSKMRYQRSSYLEVMNQDYIRTARSKGVSERDVTWVHAFRNSSLPIITLLSGLLPGLIGGSFVIENIFGIPGLGRYGTQAVMNRDYPVIMATIMFSSLLVMIGILLSDILYVVVDPRIKL
jgi:peptide/nickel transport system permease protein